MNKIGKWAGVLALILVLILSAVIYFTPGEPVQTRSSYNVPIYVEQGGAKQVFETGSELEVQSGATVDFQSGVTLGFGAATAAGNLDMGNYLISNIGAAGTDFESDGGLTLADGITTTHMAIGGGYGSTGCTVTSAGVLSCDDLITGAAGLTLSDGDAVIADDLRITGQTAITVTDSSAFTATGTYQAIQAAGNVTPTLTAGMAGDLLVLINTSNTTIKIQDTGTQMLTGDISLGQYDSLVLWSDGTNWIQIGTANN